MTCIGMSRSGHTFVANNIRSWLPEVEFTDQENRIFPKQDFDYSFIVVRDYMNWLASYLTFLRKIPREKLRSHAEVYVGRYKELLEEYLFPKRVPKSVRVCYDYFVRNRLYRQGVCEIVGGEYNEKVLDKIPKRGGYSSFDKDHYQDKGSQMAVSRRYQHMPGSDISKEYVYFLKNDKGSIQLWRENFGFTSDQEDFLNMYR